MPYAARMHLYTYKKIFKSILQHSQRLQYIKHCTLHATTCVMFYGDTFYLWVSVDYYAEILLQVVILYNVCSSINYCSPVIYLDSVT